MLNGVKTLSYNQVNMVVNLAVELIKGSPLCSESGEHRAATRGTLPRAVVLNLSRFKHPSLHSRHLSINFFELSGMQCQELIYILQHLPAYKGAGLGDGVSARQGQA